MPNNAFYAKLKSLKYTNKASHFNYDINYPGTICIVLKRERVLTITIKWAIPRVRIRYSELQLTTIGKANFLLKQADNGTVVKISNLKEHNQQSQHCPPLQQQHQQQQQQKQQVHS
jgi:hypothetical protein